jgi:cysteinyl-tRNA synthetase
MRLYNTLTRSIEEITPQNPDILTLYTCGPTVYNYAHIGNLRSFIFDDTLRRALEANGYNVKHVMNITDVGHLTSDADEGEDKLEKGAAREGKTVQEVAYLYTENFKSASAALNILPPNGYEDKIAGDTYARATNFIPQQIEMIQILIDKGFAYIAEQAIYFDVTKLPDYGSLSGQSLADKEVAVRAEIVQDSDKHHPFDFAIWFFTVGHFADHSMSWVSPWGKGFPGWHLECSAIIHTTLGDPIDIHTGGVDHIGTHHTNEIAQTQGAYGNSLASVWVHNEFMMVDGAKMSKSLGNFYTLKDITDKGFSPLSYRLLVLQAHYRSELNFSWDSLTAAERTLVNLYAWADLKFQKNLSELRVEDGEIEAFLARVKAALADDLGTASALAEVFKYTLRLSPGMTFDAEDFEQILEGLDDMLGLGFCGHEDITEAQYQLIAERETARQARDWGKADTLRKKLQKINLDVDDTPNGPRWRRIAV